MAYIEKRQRKSGVKYKAYISSRASQNDRMTFDRKSDAMRWAEETEHALLNNLPLPGEELPRDDKSIADAVSDYLAHTETLQKRSRHTIANDRLTGKRLIDRFGKTSLRNLTREDIELYKEDRLQQVGPSSVRLDMSMLSRIYEMARIRWKLDGLEYPGKNIPLPSPPPNREVIISEDQIDRLMEECPKIEKPYPLPLGVPTARNRHAAGGGGIAPMVADRFRGKDHHSSEDEDDTAPGAGLGRQYRAFGENEKRIGGNIGERSGIRHSGYRRKGQACATLPAGI